MVHTRTLSLAEGDEFLVGSHRFWLESSLGGTHLLMLEIDSGRFWSHQFRVEVGSHKGTHACDQFGNTWTCLMGASSVLMVNEVNASCGPNLIWINCTGADGWFDITVVSQLAIEVPDSVGVPN